MKGKILFMAVVAMIIAGTAMAQPQQRDPKNRLNEL
jgi:hypothetical protein